MANSDHSPCGSKTKLFHIEFSDLHVSQEDSVKPWCDQLESQLFEAEYPADEDSALVPAHVAAFVHPSQKETFREREQVAKVIEAALLCAKGCRRRVSSCPPSACDASGHGDRLLRSALLECVHAGMHKIDLPQEIWPRKMRRRFARLAFDRIDYHC